ncbi:MAG: helix-turn-helix transcriptional regulator [Clostridiaceae bacterium]
MERKEYITAREAAAKWSISARRVQRLCEQARVFGAYKFGKAWMLPASAEKPADPREARAAFHGALEADLYHVLESTTVPMPAHNPDAILSAAGEERLRLVYEAELAYLRGDFARAARCLSDLSKDDAARLRACPIAVATAISTGDYAAYTEIEAYARRFLQGGGLAVAVAELALSAAAVSCVAPEIAPERLKMGDFSALPPSARPYAHYLRAMYFNCTGRYEAMLAVAETALSFCTAQNAVAPHDIYLRLMCAVACRYLERGEEARRYLLEAMRMGLPHGFVTPFSEFAGALGALMEQCLERDYPVWRGAVISQWQRVWKNWMAFHNRFTKNNVTSVLTLREYHIAVLVAKRVPYFEIAKQHSVSVGRLKNIVTEIYAKLLISGRDELAKCVL